MVNSMFNGWRMEDAWLSKSSRGWAFNFCFCAVALKRPAVAPAEGLLIEAVLKDARVVLNRRP
jgi:hypothetical protein